MDYRNHNSILGSVAEVEWLQSITDYYFNGVRNNITPILYKLLIYLRVNKDYWNKKLIVDLYREVLKKVLY